MAPLSKSEQEALSSQVLEQLSQTVYACSSLSQLSGGSANFVYRGTLSEPLLPDDATSTATVKTVIVKHSTGFLAVNSDFKIDITRCIYEELMLHALSNFTFATNDTQVRTPCLYLYDRDIHTQIHEDLYDTTDLRTILLTSPVPGNGMSKSFPSPVVLGRKIGSWLRSFHQWASAPAQAALRQEIGKNESMRKLKYLVNYGNLIETLQKVPELIGSDEDLLALEGVRDMATRGFEKPVTDEDEDFGLLHGDFCLLNVLVSNDAKRSQTDTTGVDKIFIIDWELAQYGHRAYDLGHMIGDLYEQKHFNGADGAIMCAKGLVDGYGGLSDELAFRTAIHVGTQLIGGYYRRPRRGSEPAPEDMIVDVLKVAKDFVLKGWKRDKKWLEGSPLAFLFTKQN